MLVNVGIEIERMVEALPEHIIERVYKIDLIPEHLKNHRKREK